MKKWVITIAVGLAFVAVGFTAHWWVPRLWAFLAGNHEAVTQLNHLTGLVWRIVGTAAAVVTFVYRFWRDNKEKPSKPGATVAVEHTHAGHDSIAAGGNVQTGGASVGGQGPTSVSGSVAGRDAIGNQTIIYQQAASTAFSPLHQLPPPPADFIGREDEINELLTAVSVGGATISGLQGQGGVGKTALALKLAEKLSSNFPDAQIYMDLLGVSRKPLMPGEAMAYVIRAFQPEAKLPENEQELAGIYQSVLHGKLALLLMDNARDAAQVKPLIPPAGCMLLVTSRFHFVLPGLQAKNLETLPPDKAEELLLKIAPRIGGEAHGIARLCGYLPQALRLAATALAERVNMAPSDYRQRLADEQNRPKLLAAGNESVEASISLSYGLLDAETQKRWRMLGVFSETFYWPAAASVWRAEKISAEETLGLLTQYSMLEWNEKARRYRLHDMMRDFVRQQLAVVEQYEASLRHSHHYLEVLGLAESLYLKGGDSLMSGLALFDLERGNISAGQVWAASHTVSDRPAARVCSNYADGGIHCLALRQHPRELVVCLEAGLAAARSLGDRSSECIHLGNLGNAYSLLGEYYRAIEYYQQDLQIARDEGHRRTEGIALGNLGHTYSKLGEQALAIGYDEKALQIAREVGNRRDEGNVLGSLGDAYFSLGEYRQAVQYHEQHLKIAREVGDMPGEGEALGNLGAAYHSLGDCLLSIDCYKRQLQIAREVGHRHGECIALWNISSELDKLGHRKEAIDFAEDSLEIMEEIEDPFAPKIRKQLEEWRKA